MRVNSKIGWIADAIVPQRDKPSDLTGPIPWLRIEDFDGKYLSESRSGQGVTDEQVHAMPLRVFPRGTVVTSCSCTMGTTAIASAPVVTNQTFIGLVPRPDAVSADFLYYFLQAAKEQLQAQSSGSIQQYLSKEQFQNLRLWVPSIDQQSRITEFLDDTVSRIDRAIAARHTQVSRVSQLPWTRFAEPLHGIRTIPLRRVIKSIADGPFGSAFSSSDYVDEGPAVIRLGNIGFAVFREESLARVPEGIYERYSNAHVSPGDLLIASLGDANNHAGRACVAPDSLGSAMVKGKCYVASASVGISSNRFLAVLLSSPVGAEALVRQGTGATRSMLNFDRLLSTYVPIPTLAQQDSLLIEFEGAARDADRIVRDLLRAIGLLSEYKSSLINAAVTGELDVTTARSGIPA